MSKHLTLEDRYIIQRELNDRSSLCLIANKLDKHPSTITNEIKKHYISEQSGGYGRSFNDCLTRKNCKERTYRNTQTPCYLICSHYKKEVCVFLKSPPYVCNGCTLRYHCTLEKRTYKPEIAHENYTRCLRQSRDGFAMNEDEVKRIDQLISPLIKKGQSIHHIYVHHKDELMICEKTMYQLVHSGLIQARPIDCPRMIRFKPRKIPKMLKVDKKCRLGRTYADYLTFLENHPDCSVVEMDTVEGIKGGKVLLTLYHPHTCLLLAFLRERNDSASVSYHLHALKDQLGVEAYCKFFSVLLGDNGSEFSNPTAIEISLTSQPENNDFYSLVFYCDGGRPDQKGGIENSHTLLRRIFPKGTSFDHLTQKDIDRAINHINSYARKKLNDHCPWDAFSFFFSPALVESLNGLKIEPDQINLNPHHLK